MEKTQQRIIFIPGKNPKPRPEQHRQMLWRCLLEGVRRADHGVYDDMKEHYEQFSVVAWNYLYYTVYREAATDVPWLDALCYTHGPSKEDIAKSHTWHLRFDWLLYALYDRFEQLLEALPNRHIKNTIRETQRYFHDQDQIARHIRNLLKKPLHDMMQRGERILLIGHSMGSIIAYDALWELTHEDGNGGKVDLLTIGSPLGMRFVQHRLLGYNFSGRDRYPHNIRYWINLSAQGDLTALDRIFQDDFKEMLEFGLVANIKDICKGVYNFYRDQDGLNFHRSYGYLVNPAVGRVVADWWQGNEQNLRDNKQRCENN